jgi:hypothetical protein
LFELCLEKLEILVQKGYPKELLGPIIFDAMERMIGSYWDECFFILKSLMEFVSLLFKGCNPNKSCFYNNKKLLRLLAQHMDDLDGFCC